MMRGLRDAALAVARQVAHDLAAAGRMADMDGVLEIEMRDDCGEVVGIVVHVVAVGRPGSSGHGRAGRGR